MSDEQVGPGLPAHEMACGLKHHTDDEAKGRVLSEILAAMNKERAGDLIYWALVFGMWCDFVPTDGLRDDIERYLRSHRPQ